MERNGLLAAFDSIRQAIDSIDEIYPKCDMTPLAPQHSPIPATYFSWEDEEFSQENGDLKWIHPLNARAVFVLRRYILGGPDIARELMIEVQRIKDKIRETTARFSDDIDYKCRIVKVAPTYNYEARTWAAVEIFIQVGEYL